jgi:hypothetical protein
MNIENNNVYYILAGTIYIHIYRPQPISGFLIPPPGMLSQKQPRRLQVLLLVVLKLPRLAIVPDRLDIPWGGSLLGHLLGDIGLPAAGFLPGLSASASSGCPG